MSPAYAKQLAAQSEQESEAAAMAAEADERAKPTAADLDRVFIARVLSQKRAGVFESSLAYHCVRLEKCYRNDQNFFDPTIFEFKNSKIQITGGLRAQASGLRPQASGLR
jgi:hypothetical protein